MPRPKKKIDKSPEEIIEYLASIGQSNNEIAQWFGIDRNTLKSRYSSNLIKGRHLLNIRLRRKQMQLALRGSVPLLIFLGKQYLNQSDSGNSLDDSDRTIKVSFV